MSIHRIFAGISAIIVLTALIWGFVLVGTPGTSRQARFDDRRIGDLQLIHQTIVEIVYDGRPWEMPEDGSLRNPLPESLEHVAAQARFSRVSIDDPQTGERYGYERTGETTYELCATFNAPRNEPYNVFWNHDGGRTCFLFDVTRADGLASGTIKPAVPLR